VAALARALESQDDELRSTAVHALTEAGPAGAMAVPSLIKSLQDPVPAVRSGAAAVLANIGPAAGAALPDLRLAADRGLIPGFVAQSAIRNIQSR